MTLQLHDTGEEFILDFVFTDGATRPASVTIGLFHDGEVSGDTTNGDNLADNSDVSTITTEPAGAAYARQSASFPGDFSNSKNSGDWQSLVADQVFDTSDSTQDIDAYFILISFASDDPDADGTGTAQNHLFYTGPLSQLYDLSNVDQFTLDGAALGLS